MGWEAVAAAGGLLLGCCHIGHCVLCAWNAASATRQCSIDIRCVYAVRPSVPVCMCERVRPFVAHMDRREACTSAQIYNISILVPSVAYIMFGSNLTKAEI